MRNEIRISIVTPVLNGERFIEETILSVIEQGYSNLQYIIVDGGSTDKTVEIIKKYENHIDYWVTERDGGHGNALNKGFAVADGEIMAWLNADDKYLPWTLKTVAEIFGNNVGVQWITGIHAWWTDRGILSGSKRVRKNIYDYLTGDYKWIQQESTFWRRVLWDSSGGYISERYKLMVDGELWSRYFEHADLVHVGAILSGYRRHSENRASKHYSECLEEMEKVMEDLWLRCGDDEKTVAREIKRCRQQLKRWYARDRIRELVKRKYKNIAKIAEYRTLDYVDREWRHGTEIYRF